MTQQKQSVRSNKGKVTTTSLPFSTDTTTVVAKPSNLELESQPASIRVDEPSNCIQDTPQALSAAIDEHEKWLKDSSSGAQLDLGQSTLSRATFEAVRWTGRDLRAVKLGANVIGGLDFSDADLTDSDLTKCEGVEVGQFAGAILRRSRLPDKFEFPQIKALEEISKNCGKDLLALISACGYVLLAAMSTKDSSLISDSSTTTLPVIQTSIQIREFYIWSPVVLTLVYIYLLINLQPLWKALANLPAVFPDGREIDSVTYPWIVNKLARHFAPRLRTSKGVIDNLTALVVYVLIYATVPATITVTWLRTVRCRSLGDVFQIADYGALFIGFSVFLSVLGLCECVGTLTRRGTGTARASTARKNIASSRIRSLKSPAIAVVFAVLAWSALHGLSGDIRRAKPEGNEHQKLSALFFRPFDVDTSNVSARPENWKGSTKAECDSITGAYLKSQDLSYMNGQHSFMVHSDLRGSDLSYANLNFADLRDSNLTPDDTGSIHRRTILRNANLQNAQLDYANFGAADLRGCWMMGASINQADLQGTDLYYASIQNSSVNNTMFLLSNLEHANLSNCSCVGSRFLSARLINATMTTSDLTRSDFSFSDLTGANLQGCVLVNSNLIRAHFDRTNLAGANLRNADLRGADLRHAVNVTKTQLLAAFGDDTTLVPDALRPALSPRWPHILTDGVVVKGRASR